MTSYYNEIDPYAAQRIRDLIADGRIPAGDVDERSVLDVCPSDLDGYDQHHFFAGIAGWPLALRLAGVPDTYPVWTGSCPCQPFSASGQRKGFADERHVWPFWFHLISQCRSARIFGEQVAGPDGFAWLDLVQADMEGVGYAFGKSVLPAACVEAPHERHRIFFLADATRFGREQWGPESVVARSSGRFGGGSDAARDFSDADSTRQSIGEGVAGIQCATNGASERQDAISHRYDFSNTYGEPSLWTPEPWRERRHWAVEPSMGRVADGVSDRVDKLRCLGNAIVPQVAAAFIEAALGIGRSVRLSEDLFG